MERIPTSPPIIPPLDPSEERPLWSVMIPVYNCSQFLVYTLESVLEQGIPVEQMQIEVVDDASTDADVEKIVQEVGKGRISYYRQPQNVGSLRNFETCINHAKGHL
ncbi:glycosyltransferase family 2 protein, partial [Pontibacter roseus]|uniref:glycosyltransferase family 2 protein n=1 Tax=Pontibacter roseus TaxID=336989 RepID=UPI0012F84B3C